MAAWKLETAKARLSEVVRHARSDGPQTITVRGADTAVLLSVEDYARLVDRPGPASSSWVDRIRENLIEDIEVVRSPEGSRDFHV